VPEVLAPYESSEIPDLGVYCLLATCGLRTAKMLPVGGNGEEKQPGLLCLGS